MNTLDGPEKYDVTRTRLVTCPRLTRTGNLFLIAAELRSPRRPICYWLALTNQGVVVNDEWSIVTIIAFYNRNAVLTRW